MDRDARFTDNFDSIFAHVEVLLVDLNMRDNKLKSKELFSF